MATPVWTVPSNTFFDTLEERVTLIADPSFGQRAPIELPVYDPEKRSSMETDQFVNQENYASLNDFYIKSTGLAATPWPYENNTFGSYTPRAQNYVFKIPIATSEQPFIVNNTIETSDLIGVAIDGVPFRSPNSQRKARIGSKTYTENRAIYPIQDVFVDGSGIVESDRRFYYHTDPVLIYSKTPGQHSPIIGFAFDGNPIYGPYGYSDPKNRNSPVRIMETSYRLTDIQRANGSPPDGTFIEDYVYEVDLGDLDEFNGRRCYTPDYDDEVYAYFVTVDPNQINIPRYPYIIGPKYRHEPILPNGVFVYPGDINVEVISGSLPPGLRIEGTTIVGTPYEVTKNTQFRFVLRASNVDGISDCTFNIMVQGPDVPVWTTPAGDVAVGTIGKSTIDVDRRLRTNALQGDTALELVSARNFNLNSIVTCPAYPKAFQTNTRVIEIDLANKIVSLNKSLSNPIPRNTTIKFTYTKEHINMFVLDNAQIDYQLSAIDNDEAAGQQLSYYIPPRGGMLPPGISLTTDGRLVGFTEPIISTDQIRDGGMYDTDNFDLQPYDYGERPSNGYDNFLYDGTVFDYSDPVRSPRKLNRWYEFTVRASDGTYYQDRKFRIFVVGDDFFRADTTIMHTSSVMYTADTSYLRIPIWLTASNLGRKRANNYVTIFLDVFDPATLQGKIGYVYEKDSIIQDGELTADGYIMGLPPGMQLDQLSGEIYGAIPYQPAVTRKYQFTVKAIRYDPTSTEFAVKRSLIAAASLRQTVIKLNSVANIRDGSLISNVTGTGYVAEGTTVVSVNAVNKTVTLNKGIAIAADVGTEFVFAYVVSKSKTFTLEVIGEIESTIRFTTDGDLGNIEANFISYLAIEAETTVPNAVLVYSLVGGKLPPGLVLKSDGTIQGKVNQFATSSSPGLTTFDGNATSFDNFSTSVDRDYTFTVEARDQFLYSAVTKTFKLTVTTPNNKLYSNIYVKPFMSLEKRISVNSFLNDSGIFTREKIFRPNDLEFGVQTELKMLLYPGIETKSISEYVGAFGRSSRKHFRIGSLKTATAKKPGTNTVIYELIYLEILDNLETDSHSVPTVIRTKNMPYRMTVNQGRRDLIDGDTTNRNNLTQYRKTKMEEDVLPRIQLQDRVLSADFGGQLISDVDKIIFGNSITNIRKKIESIGDTERKFLPLWMRTPQTRSGIEQGFTKAIPLCYCLPGQADYIMLNIKNSGFDFKMIDFTVDRAIIDSVTGQVGDKYIAFAAREVING